MNTESLMTCRFLVFNQKFFVTYLMPRSHRSLNMFKSCLVKHDLKLFSLQKLLADTFLLQIQHKLKNMFKFT